MKVHVYNTLLFLHIMLVIVWVGGGIAAQIFVRRARNAPPEAMASIGQTTEWIGSKVFGPASGLVFVLGVVMTFMYEYWSEPWIWIAIAGFAASSIVGGVMISKQAKALTQLVESGGPTAPGVAEGQQRLLMLANIDLVILIVVIWDMTYKPFTGMF